MEEQAHGRGGTDGADERAQRLERQLKAAQQITHIGSWEWELETNRVSWSDELYRIYGLEPQSCEITFELFMSFLHPAERERVQREVRQALERGGAFSYPERIVRPDGTIRELDTVGEVARDASGRVRGLIGTCRDVTEERKRDETIRLYASIVERVQIGLSVWAVADPDHVEDSRLIAANLATETIVGAPLGESLGRTLAEVVPTVTGTELSKALARVARGAGAQEIPEFRDGLGRTFRIKTFPLPHAAVGVAAEDISGEVSARALKAAEQHVLELIASGEPLQAVLTEIVLAIEQQAPDTIGSILLVDEAGRVRHGAAPSLPGAFVRAIDGEKIGPRVGSCGTAAYRREPVFVTDIDSDPLWTDYRDLAREHGLRACWSTPIFASEGRVTGTFALYYRQPRGPTPEDVELIARAAHLARIAIQRSHLVDQLRALSAHVESVREDERTGIAREIHDELGQTLTALKMDVDWIGRRVRQPPIDARAIEERVLAMSRMIDEVIDRVRRISSELRPGVLDDLGLLAALEWQGQEFERRTGTTCAIQGRDAPLDIDRAVATAIFRIFQEAITNVLRHADATRVDVLLEQRDDRLVLEVEDDGKGIEPEAVERATSFGLLGIRERALQLGGSATVTRRPEGGTRVWVEVPLARGAVT